MLPLRYCLPIVNCDKCNNLQSLTQSLVIERVLPAVGLGLKYENWHIAISHLGGDPYIVITKVKYNSSGQPNKAGFCQIIWISPIPEKGGSFGLLAVLIQILKSMLSSHPGHLTLVDYHC